MKIICKIDVEKTRLVIHMLGSVNPLLNEGSKPQEMIAPAPVATKTEGLEGRVHIPEDAPHVMDDFTHKHSWQAIFAPHVLDGKDVAERMYRTDGEPDDEGSFAKMVQSVDHYVTEFSNQPDINVIVSEGNEETLKKKAEALKVVLCAMVVEKLAHERVLDSFHFHTDRPRAADPQKEAGYENIYQAAEALKQAHPEIESLLQRLGPTESVDTLYERLDAARANRRGVPRIDEISIAPINGLMERYATHPDLAPFVRYSGYGSFNIGAALERAAKEEGTDLATQVAKAEKLFGSFGSNFNLEAYLATRVPYRKGGEIQRDAQGNIRWNDFNRVGANTHPEIFASLLSPDASPMQQFFLHGFQGWNDPAVQERVEDLSKLPNGVAFLRELEERVALGAGAFSVNQAIDLCNQHFPEAPADAKLKKIFDKKEGKVKVLYDLLINNKIQGTLSDMMLATVLEDPAQVIDPRCLTKARIALKLENSRVNTSFVPDPNGNAFAIESRHTDTEDTPGIKTDRMKTATREFFESLGDKSASEGLFARVWNFVKW
jgi:hypothetical protein